MAYPEYLRLRARALRLEKHLTLDELAERLALPRTTVYYWIRDLPLGKPRRGSAGQRKGTLAMQAKYRRLRENAYQQGQIEYDDLAAVPTFRDFVALYIAEGYKRDRNRVSIGNSDSRVVSLAAAWISTFTIKRMSYTLHYHADQNLQILCAYWGGELGIDGLQIVASRKSKSGQLRGRVWRSEHGVLTVSVNDTLLRARIQGWIDRIKDEWALHSGPATGRGAAW